MLKKLLVVATLAVSSVAHAGFFTGVAVGSLLSGGGGGGGSEAARQSGPSGTLIKSDTEGRDVIFCYPDLELPNRCMGKVQSPSGKLWIHNPTYGEYVGAHGYKVIHNKAIFFHSDGRVMLLLEVSK